MRRAIPTRRHQADLIARPPLGGVGVERIWASLIIDPVHQLQALADLRDRGLISPAEFSVQRQRILVVDPEHDSPS
jgi:Short C-terminal domain